MRKFTTSDSQNVDLDNPKTYSHLPNTYDELRDIMFKQIGYAIVYMDYFPQRNGFFPKRKKKDKFVKFSDMFPNYEADDKLIEINNVAYNQRLRVIELIKKFAENEREHLGDDNLMWLKEQIFIFEDETENMC